MTSLRPSHLLLGLGWIALLGAGLSSPQAQKTQQSNLDLQIFSSPRPVEVCVGGAASFSVQAYPRTVTYLWRKDGVALVPAQTGSTLLLPAVSEGDAGSYDVVVSLGSRSRTSAAADLMVLEGPVITAQPGPAVRTVSAGVTIVYSVEAIGSGPLTYQWRKRPLTAFAPWEDIPGATAPVLTLPNVTGADAGAYRCVVRDDCGPTATNQVRLRVL